MNKYANSLLVEELPSGSKMQKELYKEACNAILDNDIEYLEKNSSKIVNLKLSDQVVKFAKNMRNQQQTLNENSYALNTGTEKLMPINNAKEVKASNLYFDKYHNKFPEEWRVKAANALVKSAKLYGVTPSRTSMAYVCHDKSLPLKINMFEASSRLQKRANLAKDTASKKVYEATSTLIGSSETHNVAELLKMAHMVERLDRKNYINHRVNPPLLDLLQEVPFEKIAAIQLINKSVSVDKLMSIPVEKYEKALGKDITKRFVDSEGVIDKEKLTKIIPTLPRAEKEILEKHIS